MFYEAYTMLLHTPNYMGGMQLITCVTDESKTNSKVTSCEFGQRGTCTFLLIIVFYSVLIAEAVGSVGHFRKWTAFNFCFQL